MGGGHPEEQREYFRIDDEVGLDWRVLEVHAHAALAAGLLEETDLSLRLQALSHQAAPFLAALRKRDADLAHYLHLLERQIELIARAVAGTAPDTVPRQPVTLGGGGVDFPSATAVAPGSLLEVRLVLFPSHVSIHALAEVIHCQAAAPAGYRIGSRFTHISETARDALVRHTLELQSERLRRQRES